MNAPPTHPRLAPAARLLAVVALSLMGAQCGLSNQFVPARVTIEPFSAQHFFTENDLEKLNNAVLKSLTNKTASSEQIAGTPGNNASTWDTFVANLFKQGVSTFVLNPDCHESLGALLQQRCLVMLITSRYDSRAPIAHERSISDNGRAISDSSNQSRYALQSVTASRFQEGIWTFSTSSGISFSGPPSEIVSGKVLPLDIDSAQPQYVQLAEVCILSAVGASLLQQHLDEWYQTMPAGTCRSELVQLIPVQGL